MATESTQQMRYLRLLSKQYPTTQAAYTEVINLEAKLGLPKSAEHFMSDVHGEHQAFEHILNNCSGVIREFVEHTFGDSLDDHLKDEFCTLIYYPRERLAQLRRRHLNFPAWYSTMLMRLVILARRISSHYTRSHVRKALPKEYGGIIEELLRTSGPGESSRHEYHKRISVPRAGRAYLDWCDRIARRAWHTGDQCSLDWMWYLWCGRRSPLSGRVMKTFERTFVLDKSTWVEAEDPYFRLTDDASVCTRAGRVWPHGQALPHHQRP